MAVLLVLVRKAIDKKDKSTLGMDFSAPPQAKAKPVRSPKPAPAAQPSSEYPGMHGLTDEQMGQMRATRDPDTNTITLNQHAYNFLDASPPHVRQGQGASNGAVYPNGAVAGQAGQHFHEAHLHGNISPRAKRASQAIGKMLYTAGKWPYRPVTVLRDGAAGVGAPSAAHEKIHSRMIQEGMRPFSLPPETHELPAHGAADSFLQYTGYSRPDHRDEEIFAHLAGGKNLGLNHMAVRQLGEHIAAHVIKTKGLDAAHRMFEGTHPSMQQALENVKSGDTVRGTILHTSD